MAHYGMRRFTIFEPEGYLLCFQGAGDAVGSNHQFGW